MFIYFSRNYNGLVYRLITLAMQPTDFCFGVKNFYRHFLHFDFHTGFNDTLRRMTETTVLSVL